MKIITFTSQRRFGGLGCLFSKNILWQNLRTSCKLFHTPAGSTILNDDLLDPKQLQLLEEQCILVDDNDKVIRATSKKECHLMENINKGLVHRAFSVFLFNTKGELLIQQRSDVKITFPGCFTNTCCSHPLYNDLELEEKNALGVRRAAQRRLNVELGISPDQLNVEDFCYITRIQYKAPSNGKWGESEVDYILVAQKDVDLNVNSNEVKSWCYVKKTDFQSFLDSLVNEGHILTPWFLLITNSFLMSLWNNLHNLSGLIDHKTIHKM